MAAAAGAFETYGQTMYPQRFLFWLLVFVSSTILARMCGQLAYSLNGPNRPVMADVIKVLAMVVVFTPILWLLTNLLINDIVQDGPSYFILAQSVAGITTAICIARRILPGFERVSYGKPKNETSAPALIDTPSHQPRLMRRLPETFQGPILRLAVRDHLVDVVSSTESQTIRIRFLDAVDEMDETVGFCTHRSHWVARDAVAGIERENNRVFLRICNNDIVPVSRKFKPDLERAGLL